MIHTWVKTLGVRPSKWTDLSCKEDACKGSLLIYVLQHHLSQPSSAPHDLLHVRRCRQGTAVCFIGRRWSHWGPCSRNTTTSEQPTITLRAAWKRLIHPRICAWVGQDAVERSNIRQKWASQMEEEQCSLAKPEQELLSTALTLDIPIYMYGGKHECSKHALKLDIRWDALSDVLCSPCDRIQNRTILEKLVSGQWMTSCDRKAAEPTIRQ